MNELMRHIEKAVRPVKANAARKLNMREELLAHLIGIKDEEFAKTGDRDSAMQAAIQRFGAANHLSQKLQSSVPWFDRFLPLFNPVQYWPQLSHWRLTCCCSIAQIMLVMLAISLTSLGLSGIVNLEIVAVGFLMLLLIPALFFVFFATAGAFHGVLRHRKSPRRAILYGVGLGIYLGMGAIWLFAESRLDVFQTTYIIVLTIGFPTANAMLAKHVGYQILQREQFFARLKPWQAIELSD